MTDDPVLHFRAGPLLKGCFSATACDEALHSLQLTSLPGLTLHGRPRFGLNDLALEAKDATGHAVEFVHSDIAEFYPRTDSHIFGTQTYK